MQTTDEQILEVVRLREDENKTFLEIAEELEISDRTVRRRYEAGILHRSADGLVDTELETFPGEDEIIVKVSSDFLNEEIAAIERFKPLVREGNAMLTCDFHIPLHDPSLINVLIRAAKKNRIKSLIIAGDFFNMDEFSSYPPVQPEAKFKIERKQGNLVLKTLLRWFDDIDIIWGNHDFRLARSMGYKYSFTECMKWCLSGLTEKEMAKLRFSDLDYMHYYPTPDRKIHICHPSNYSDVPLAVGLKLAKKYSCGVYTAHSHHCAIGVAPNGSDLIIEGGGFFDKTRTEYIQRTTYNHEWIQGFFFFKDGIPHMVSPVTGTDREYRKEVAK